MRRLSKTQVVLLLDAWNNHLYRRGSGAKHDWNTTPGYGWNTRTDRKVTDRQLNRLVPDLLVLVDLPNGYGLESRRYIPTAEAEDILIKKGLLERP